MGAQFKPLLKKKCYGKKLVLYFYRMRNERQSKNTSSYVKKVRNLFCPWWESNRRQFCCISRGPFSLSTYSSQSKTVHGLILIKKRWLPPPLTYSVDPANYPRNNRIRIWNNNHLPLWIVGKQTANRESANCTGNQCYIWIQTFAVFLRNLVIREVYDSVHEF